MREYISASPLETEQLGTALAAELKPGMVVAFFGDMGSGKTVFTRGLAKGLHCTEHVSSPTFALVHEYPGKITLYHFDMYRIMDTEDLYATGYDDYLESGGILAIEWSENIEDALPEHTIFVTITADGPESRTIEFDSERELTL